MQVVLRAEATLLGFTRYFTGKPCKHGHIAERQRSSGECIACANLRPKAPVDPIKKKANDARHHAKFRDKHLAANVARYEANKEKYQGLVRKYHAENKESISAYKKKWNEENSKRIAEKNRQKLINNRGYYNSLNAERRAAKRRAIPKWSRRSAVRFIYENCPSGMVVDHIVPLRGKTVCGLHVEHNLSYLTALANSEKGNFWWPDMW